MAIGAMHAVRTAGLAVPDDISVVGYDDIYLASHTNPPLTTIEPDLDQAGRLLVEAVTAAEEAQHPSVRRVPVRLLERASS